MHTIRAVSYTIVTSIVVFLCNNLITLSLLSSSNKFSSVEIDLIAWGIPAFVASLVTAKKHPTNLILKAITITLTTFVLIFSTTETINHAQAAQESMLVKSFYLLPYTISGLSIVLGFFLGFRRRSPN